MTSDITIRPVRKDDLETLATLESHVWTGLGATPLAEDTLAEWYTERSPFFLVAKCENALCGFYFGRMITMTEDRAQDFLDSRKMYAAGVHSHPHDASGKSVYGITMLSVVPKAGKVLYEAVWRLKRERHILYSIGIIDVGPKRSGDAFAAEDLQLLNTFVYQAANALLRVSLHQKVERHAKHLERTVQKKTKQIRALQEKQQQMILDVSHNLQTPLAIFQTQLEHAKGAYLSTDTFAGLEHSLMTLSQFIYDLLALTAMENTLKQETRERFSMSDTVEDALEELGIICADTGIRIVGSIAPSLWVRGNPKRIREALMNLLSNSVKYIGARDPKEIRVSLMRHADSVALIISDTGIGISSDELPHIFDRFYRAKQSEGASTGTGLGLAIAKSVIEQHGGTISVASSPNEGTTFTVTLYATL